MNVARVYANEKETIEQNTAYLKSRLMPRLNYGAAPEFSEEQLAAIASKFIGAIDPTNGGLRGAPKFPNTSIFNFLWRAGLRYGLKTCLEEVKNTLLHICQGGIYDHIGGGFSRYSVDERWLVPHFEKMLYDNALLIELMTEVWKETQSDRLRAGWPRRSAGCQADMLVPGGGFASSYDADSEGEEGKFYVWTAAEITNVLGHGEQAALFAQVYDVSEGGNWEGKTILNRLNALALLNRDEEQALDECRPSSFRCAKSARSRAGTTRYSRTGTVSRSGRWQGGGRVRQAGMDQARGGRLRLRLQPHDFRRPPFPLLPGGESERPCHFDGLCEHDFRGAGALSGHEREALSRRRDRLDSDHEPPLRRGERRLLPRRGRHQRSHHRPLSASDDAFPNPNATMLQNLADLYTFTGDAAYLKRADGLLARSRARPKRWRWPIPASCPAR